MREEGHTLSQREHSHHPRSFSRVGARAAEIVTGPVERHTTGLSEFQDEN